MEIAPSDFLCATSWWFLHQQYLAYQLKSWSSLLLWSISVYKQSKHHSVFPQAWAWIAGFAGRVLLPIAAGVSGSVNAE